MTTAGRKGDHTDQWVDGRIREIRRFEIALTLGVCVLFIGVSTELFMHGELLWGVMAAVAAIPAGRLLGTWTTMRATLNLLRANAQVPRGER